MNYLAGMVTRVIRNEEESFWTLTCLFENILPLDYFCLMTEILVDQKVFIQIFKKRKPKLFKHLQNAGLDFAIISFQWLVCLLSANLQKEISETIWDFMFLEGTVSIFKSILAILSMIEPQILQETEFNEIYVILDSKVKEWITSPDLFIKHMNKFGGIEEKSLNKLRNKYRPIIIAEQEVIWMDTSRSGCPGPSDTAIFKRVKLINKFFLLNRAMRKCKNDAVVAMDESKLTLSGSLK